MRDTAFTNLCDLGLDENVVQFRSKPATTATQMIEHGMDRASMALDEFKLWLLMRLVKTLAWMSVIELVVIVYLIYRLRV
jgi:uroporphyrinogen-III decarboxylase